MGSSRGSWRGELVVLVLAGGGDSGIALFVDKFVMTRIGIGQLCGSDSSF